jgi:hypothetical protein
MDDELDDLAYRIAVIRSCLHENELPQFDLAVETRIARHFEVINRDAARYAKILLDRRSQQS